MIKNSLYTFDYFQPEEYHFSLDSVFLAQKVAKIIQPNALTEMKVLDLCSGCGVIGLELSLHSPKKLTIDFLEVQEVYESFFRKNLEMIHPHLNKSSDQYRFWQSNYQALLEPGFENLYDLIICSILSNGTPCLFLAANASAVESPVPMSTILIFSSA